MQVVDSNVLIAYYNVDDALHQKALSLNLSQSVINQLVFAETANVLQKRLADKHLLRKIIQEINSNLEILSITGLEFNLAVDLFKLHCNKLSFTDCSLLAQSKTLGRRIVTFDEDLAKAANNT